MQRHDAARSSVRLFGKTSADGGNIWVKCRAATVGGKCVTVTGADVRLSSVCLRSRFFSPSRVPLLPSSTRKPFGRRHVSFEVAKHMVEHGKHDAANKSNDNMNFFYLFFIKPGHQAESQGGTQASHAPHSRRVHPIT